MPRPKPKTPEAPRWQRRPAARPEEILRAALAVFGDAGYERARLSDIARAAGVSKAGLYLYFDSKEALFGELVRRFAASALDQEDVAAGFFPETPEKRLRRFIRESWTALRRPELLRLTRLVHAEANRFPVLAEQYFREVIQRLRDRLERVLENGRSRGVFRALPDEFALHALPSFLLHQALLRPGLLAADPRPLTDQQLVDGSADLLLNGILRRSPRGNAE